MQCSESKNVVKVSDFYTCAYESTEVVLEKYENIFCLSVLKAGGTLHRNSAC